MASAHGHTFKVFQEVDEHFVPRQPFMIVETFPCSDGLRSRICSGRYETKDEALTQAATWEANR